MDRVGRPFACLGALALLASCDRAPEPAVSRAEDGVLDATENSKDFGDYVVYVNALNTDQLTPEVARQYGIVRSKSRAMLTVSVHKKQPAGAGKGVKAGVSASAVSLGGQLKPIALLEIMDGDSFYYVGQLVIGDEETLLYDVEVLLADRAEPMSIRYQKQFFVDD
jgi:hypothetical protein